MTVSPEELELARFVFNEHSPDHSIPKHPLTGEEAVLFRLIVGGGFAHILFQTEHGEQFTNTNDTVGQKLKEIGAESVVIKDTLGTLAQYSNNPFSAISLLLEE